MIKASCADAFQGLHKGLFLRKGESPGGGLPGECLGDLRHCLFQGRGVDSDSGDGFPCDLVLPGIGRLRIAHVCLDGVLNCLRFCLGFLDQPLQLSKLLTFHFQFVDAHGFLLSWWWMVVKIVSEPFPPRVAGRFSDKLHWVGCLYLRG